MIAVGQLLGETRLTHQQRDLVNTIRCSGETLLALITDILDFSKIEANKLSLYIHDFSLQSIIEDTIEIAGLKAAQKKLHEDQAGSSERALQRRQVHGIRDHLPGSLRASL